MIHAVSRRDFIRHAASGVGAVSLGSAGNWAIAASDADAQAWSFTLLGDLHIDQPDHHDMQWLEREHPGDVAQVQNYSRITREVTPQLLDRVRREMTASETPLRYVIQLGDLIEGLCGSDPLATKQATDAMQMIRAAQLPAPFLFTKGNHDITGPGAAEVYDRTLVPFMAAQANDTIDQAAFVRRRGGDLLVFYDAYDRQSLDWFARTVDEQQPRRLIVVIHPPVVPYNARSTWHVYSSPSQAQQRQRLLAILGARRAIVLCGHLHKYSFLVRRTEHGSFTQLAISSVGDRIDAPARDLIENLQSYGPELVDLEPRHSPESIQRRRQLLQAECPFIQHFQYANTWGHAVVRLHADRVEAAVYRGLGDAAWKSLTLWEAG